MTSVASGNLIQFQSRACDLPDYPSSVNSGIVGDAAHRRNNSYHNSKNDNPNKTIGAYTNKWPKDIAAGINRSLVTGTDRSMSRADMIKSWNRHWVVFQNRATDPRAQYIAEYIGTPDGVNAKRMDFADGSVDSASEDHTWHEHEGWWYLYADSAQAAKASLSIKRGETVAQYLGGNMAGLLSEAPHANRMVWRVADLVGMKPTITDSGTPPEENKLVNHLLAMDAKLTLLLAANGAVVTDEQLNSLADRIAEAVIAADTNELTSGDLANVKDAVKAAFREGTGA